MDDEDRAYLERRVNAELASARRATSPAAIRAHYVMLSHYLRRLDAVGFIAPDKNGAAPR